MVIKDRTDLFIEQRTAKHHNKHQVRDWQHPRYSSQERRWKRSRRSIAPTDDKRQNNADKEREGGKRERQRERTEGTIIIYVNNVPLLLIISGEIKQKWEGRKHHACHPTDFSYAN